MPTPTTLSAGRALDAVITRRSAADGGAGVISRLDHSSFAARRSDEAAWRRRGPRRLRLAAMGILALGTRQYAEVHDAVEGRLSVASKRGRARCLRLS